MTDEVKPAEPVSDPWAPVIEKLKDLSRMLGEASGEGWCALLDVLAERTNVERERLAFQKECETAKMVFQKEREARQAREDLEFRLLYEKRTMEFQAIAMRLGDMVEKQYHTVR